MILDTLKLKIANLNIFVGFTLGYWSFLQSKTEDCYALLFEKLKEGRRIDVIAIKPIKGLFYLISKGDRKVRKLSYVFHILLISSSRFSSYKHIFDL